MKAKLILENNMVFHGRAFGYISEAIGEVVFNTTMSGYEEVLTNPSYHGKILVMTYPLVGNYGINLDDNESDKVHVSGVIVKECCKNPNNFRCELELNDYLKAEKIMGLEGIDTRALSKVIRDNGSLKGIILTEDVDISDEEIFNRLKNFSDEDSVKSVSTSDRYKFSNGKRKAAVIDLGVKKSLLNLLSERDFEVTIYPYNVDIEEINGYNPDLVLLSSGPGSPIVLNDTIKLVKDLSKTYPIFGVGLGHEVIALALGGEVTPLPYGHIGCNHPVKDLRSNKIYITSQNHGYHVSKVPEEFSITHRSVNDSTVEGMRHNTLPIYSVQFNPEGCPGPSDCVAVIDEFLELVK